MFCNGLHGLFLGSRAKPLDDQIWKLILSEITCNILEKTPIILGSIKEGIMEILDEHLGKFHTELVAMVSARSLNFRECRAYGAPKFFGIKDPISSRILFTNIKNSFRTSFSLEGLKVSFASCFLKDRARD